MKVDITGAVKKNRATSGFVFQGMLGRSLCVSGPFKLQLPCENISDIDYDHYDYLITITHL